jgi:hypothetical protein
LIGEESLIEEMGALLVEVIVRRCFIKECLSYDITLIFDQKGLLCFVKKHLDLFALTHLKSHKTKK